MQFPQVATTFALVLLAHSTPVFAQGILYSWPVESGHKGAVAHAGDVDGDGIADYALGESHESRVRVRSGQDGAQLLAIQGLDPADGFGRSILSLGDVNADGSDDLAIAAQWPSAAGEAYLQLVSGVSGAVMWQLDAPAGSLSFGGALEALGDVDGDAVLDLVVSVEVGARWLLVSGANGSVLRELVRANGQGEVLEVTEDVDGDGVLDFFLGAPTYDGDRGRVSLRSGVSGALLRTYEAPADSGGFGAALASPGDVDGDGVPDILVGSPYEVVLSGVSGGRARLYSGASAQLLLDLDPGAAGGGNLVFYGAQAATCADMDGDGLRELIVTAGSYHVGCCAYYPAELRVQSSVTGELLFLGDGLGVSGLNMVPDVNGDGLEDFLLTGNPAGWGWAPGTPYPTTLALNNVFGPSYWTWLCPAATTSDGCDVRLFYEGAPSLTLGQELAVRADNLPAGAVGFFARSRGFSSPPMGSSGPCLTAPIHRFSVQTTTTDGPPCSGSSQPTGEINLTLSKSTLVSLGFVPGDWFFLQGFARDTSAPPGQEFATTTLVSFPIWP